MKIGIVQFPGSNCDRDCFHVVQNVCGHQAQWLWHRDVSVGDVDVVVIPGGFSYGDYLRCGAMAAHSPIMTAVKNYAANGGRVLGICNGFQILIEAGLLPGALMRNANLQFICKPVMLRVESTQTSFTKKYTEHSCLTMPIAHMEGNYFADDTTLAELQKNEQIIFRYCDAQGAAAPSACPNGARDNIAGICNRDRNVVGMMPHPERVCETILGGADGLPMFQ